MLKQRYDYVFRKTGTKLGCRFKGTNQPRSLHDALDDDSHHGARRLAPTNPGERPQRRGLFRNRVLYTEALEPPAERLQRDDGAHQSSPCGLRRKAAAIAERNRRDRGDERVIIKLWRNETGTIDRRHGGVIRVVAGPGKEIELSGEHFTNRRLSPHQAVPPGPPRLDVEPHFLLERL